MDMFALQTLYSDPLTPRLPFSHLLRSRGNHAQDKVVPTQHPALPLRHRPLPASFWQEPNRPTISNISDIFPFYVNPALPRTIQEQMLAYKTFLDKLNTTQPCGIIPSVSRYPITEFLYHNYGQKNMNTADYLKTSSSATGARIPFATISSPSSFGITPYPPLALPGVHTPKSNNGKVRSMGPRNILSDTRKTGIVKPIATKSRVTTSSNQKSTHRFHPFLNSKLKHLPS